MWAGNKVTSFPAIPDLAPQQRSGGRIVATDELAIHSNADKYTVDGSGTVSRLPSWPRNIEITLRFTGTPTFVHSSRLIMPGAVNKTFASGDTIKMLSLGDGVWMGQASGLQPANNLSDVANAATARANLGIDRGHTRVRAVATSNVTISSGLENGDTIDGVTLATGDLVLLAAQTSAAENGVYVAVSSGAASRHPDFNSYNAHPAAYFSVMEGATEAGTLWRCNSAKGGTLGSTAISILPAAPGVLVWAHKNGVPQDLASVGVDYAITFSKTKVNYGSLFNTSTGEFVLPKGTFRVILNLNFTNPADQGKYYAFILKEGIQQIGLSPRRMSGSSDTMATACEAILFGDGTSKFKPAAQHSNDSGSKRIDGQESATFFIIEKISDEYVPDPLTNGTTGAVLDVVDPGSFTYIDMDNKLIVGKTVTKVGNFSNTNSSHTFPVKIVKRVSAGTVDVISSTSNVHPGDGWHDTDLATPWVVPNDGYDYYLGCYTTGISSLNLFDMAIRRATKNTDISGTGVSVTEAAGGVGVSVIGVRATYA